MSGTLAHAWPAQAARSCRRVVVLADFEEAVALSAPERASFRRRFVTLFVDDARSRRGGLGRVTFAENALGESLAVKTLICPEREDGESEADHARRAEVARAAFRQEYECHRALSGLRGFPRLYGWGLADGEPAIVMEWVEGQTLADASRGLAVDDAGRLSPLAVARLGRDLFELLARMGLAGEGLVHRDVSPANVMVRTDQVPVPQQVEEGTFDLCLVDFGSATPTPGAHASFTLRARAVRGATAEYAPPEMLTQDLPGIDALRKSASIDVFAAASVLFELLSGSLPFPLRAEKDEPAVSPYRAKTEAAPTRPLTAHAPGSELGEVLSREPEVAVAVARAASDLGAAPSEEEVRRALELVDDQLVDMLMPCLSVRQEARPSARALRDGLAAFCSGYADNVRRALCREPLSPCTSGVAWLPFLSNSGAWRAVRAVGRVAAAASWLAVATSTAVLANGTAASFSLARLSWEGALPGAAVPAALAVPAVAALAARGRDVSGQAGLVRGTVALLASSALVCGLCALVRTVPEVRSQGLLAAVFATSAAVWLALVLDYAVPRVPALVAERRRLRAANAATQPLSAADAPELLGATVPTTTTIPEVSDEADE